MVNERIPLMPSTPVLEHLQAAQLTCAECGATFVPRRVGDGVEELCDACYENHFVAREVHSEKLVKRVA